MRAKGKKEAMEVEAVAAAMYTWVAAAAAAAAVDTTMDGRLRTPGPNGLPSTPPVGSIPPSPVPSPGLALPLVIPPPPPVPEPPVPGPPLPALVNIILGAPLELRTLAAA